MSAPAAAVVGLALIAAFCCCWAVLRPELHGASGSSSSFLLPLHRKSRMIRQVVDDGIGLTGAAVTGGDHEVFGNRPYYTCIYIGNPARPYFLDIDTATELTWIECDAPCTSCAKGPHQLYKPTEDKLVTPKDSSCQELQGNLDDCETCRQCDYEIQYADGSSSMGFLARDYMHLITAKADLQKMINFTFGCAYAQQGQLLTSSVKTDGILGLSNSRISLLSQLADQGIVSNVFGHCIDNNPDRGGYLFLGASYVPKWGMTWAPIGSARSNIYSTVVDTISYGGQHIISSTKTRRKMKKLIFDCGSLFTYFPDEAYLNLVASINGASPHLVPVDRNHSHRLPLCWNVGFPVSSMDEVQHLFKPIRFHFKKRWMVMPTTFTLSPEAYLVITEAGEVCLGILNGKRTDLSSAIVLGGAALGGKLIVYDNEVERIGWMESECSHVSATRTVHSLLLNSEGAVESAL